MPNSSPDGAEATQVRTGRMIKWWKGHFSGKYFVSDTRDNYTKSYTEYILSVGDYLARLKEIRC